VKLFQFVGKDNIPFHTVIFPASQLGTGEEWTTVHHISSTEYMNYEGGKFSKSKGVGVFGNDAKETGIPADVWRFYIFYNRPETSDFDFTWKDFQEKVNAELINNFGNLVNRTLQFVSRFYGGELPAGKPDEAFWQEVRAAEKEIEGLLEKVELRDAFKKIFALSSIGNKKFQDGAPWKGIKENAPATADLIWNLTYLVRDLAVLASPYVPVTSERIGKTLGLDALAWKDLGTLSGIDKVEKPDLLFARLEDKEIDALRDRFSGTQKERSDAAAASAAAAAPAPAEIAARFRASVDLRAAKIVEIRRHPDAEKLYIETVDVGAEKRTIVSGLVPHYKEEELLGHTVVLVANLKPALLRGVESQGMLLAASEGKTVEVLFVDHAQPGDRVTLAGGPVPAGPSAQIDVDTFFATPIAAVDFRITVGDAVLECGGKQVVTTRVTKGRVK
jgi:methionyl-tRNA synthetase